MMKGRKEENTACRTCNKHDTKRVAVTPPGHRGRGYTVEEEKDG